MTMISFSFLFSILTSTTLVFSKKTDDFKWNLNFEDNHNLVREALIDISSSTSFVVGAADDSKRYSKDSFNPKLSQTFKQNGCFSARYSPNFSDFAGACNGISGLDGVHISSSLKVDPIFGICKQIYGTIARGASGRLYAGRLGFAPRKSMNEESLTNEMIRAWDKPILCLWTDLENEAKKSKGGKDLAGIDNTIVNVQVDPKSSYWSFNIASFSIGSTHFPPSTIVLSTTTDRIRLPAKLCQEVGKALGATYLNGEYWVQCGVDRPSLLLNLNGKIVEIEGQDLVEKRDKRCVLAISNSVLNYIVVGAPILRKNGVCLDFKARSMAFFKPTGE